MGKRVGHRQPPPIPSLRQSERGITQLRVCIFYNPFDKNMDEVKFLMEICKYESGPFHAYVLPDAIRIAPLLVLKRCDESDE